MSDLFYNEIKSTMINSNRIVENYLEMVPDAPMSEVMANLKGLCPYDKPEQIKIFNECVLGHMHNTKPAKRLKQMSLF